jgi:hypothetical protein
MHGDRDVVLECEPPVPGDVIGVRVGLERARDADACAFRRREVLLDRVGGVHHEGFASGGVTDQVGGAAKIVVDELAEQHHRKLTPPAARFLEVLPDAVAGLWPKSSRSLCRKFAAVDMSISGEGVAPAGPSDLAANAGPPELSPFAPRSVPRERNRPRDGGTSTEPTYPFSVKNGWRDLIAGPKDEHDRGLLTCAQGSSVGQVSPGRPRLRREP